MAAHGPATPATAGAGTAPAAPDASVPGAAVGFPRDEPVNVQQMGPYAFDKYSDGLDNPTYTSSIMYYPTDAPPPFAIVLFSPAFTVTMAEYEQYLGPLLATHGIAILLTTPTTTSDVPTLRGDDLEAALMQIQAENSREGSPLKGKIATDRVCVSGHSMGGGGSLWAANKLGDKLKCAVPLQPWQPGQRFDKVTAATLFIAAEADNVAGVSSNARFFYDSIPQTVPKYYVEFAGASHYLTTNTLGEHYDVQSRYMVAFYKRFLEDDKRYQEVLDAPGDAVLSEYEHMP